jgi:outer membrane protein OmpA-like peptidoglycan-associated protein
MLRAIHVRLDIEDAQPGTETRIVQRAGFFARGTAKLTQRGKAKMRQLAAAVPVNGELTGVYVTGVSIKEPSRKRNRTLAQKRSDKVAAFLSQHGFAANITVSAVARETGLSNRSVEQTPQPLFTRRGKPLTTATVIYTVTTK